MEQKKARVTAQLHETFAKAFRMESTCRTVKAWGQFQKHLGLDCPLEGAEIGGGGRKKRQGNEQNTDGNDRKGGNALKDMGNK